MRSTIFQQRAWEEFIAWSRRDIKLFHRLVELIDEAKRTPFEGKGKPEPLKGNLKGYWSRRITDEHRLVYRVDDERITVVARKGHYS